MMDENNELDDNMDLQGDTNSANEPAAFSNPDEVKSSDKILTDLADFDDLDETQFGADVVSESFEFLQDLEMNVYIELGRTKMFLN
jgi:flagellar motor switch/type III secretory pathway protein FliN